MLGVAIISVLLVLLLLFFYNNFLKAKNFELSMFFWLL